MALTRRKKTYLNPFIREFNGELENILFDADDDMSIRIEDVIIGCVRCYHADTDKRQEYVKWQNILRLYRSLDEISKESVKDCLQVSDRQCERYIRVLRLCTPLLVRELAKPSTNVKGYIHLTASQVEAGYLTLLRKK